MRGDGGPASAFTARTAGADDVCPDHPAVQRAYSETAVEVAEGGEVVLDLGTGPTSARVVAPFVNLAQGIPSSLAALLADEPG